MDAFDGGRCELFAHIWALRPVGSEEKLGGLVRVRGGGFGGLGVGLQRGGH